MRPTGTIQVLCPHCGEFTPLTGTFLIMGEDESFSRDICRNCDGRFNVDLTININRLEKVKEKKDE